MADNRIVARSDVIELVPILVQNGRGSDLIGGNVPEIFEKVDLPVERPAARVTALFRREPARIAMAIDQQQTRAFLMAHQLQAMAPTEGMSGGGRDSGARSFSLLEAGHSLNDRLKVGAAVDFFDVQEFAALKCLRNYFHHQKELRHVVRLIPIGSYPIVTDLMTLCLVPRDIVVTAIETTKRYQEETREACQQMFHGPVVNINPALSNFVFAAYERLTNRSVPLAGEAVEGFEAGYAHEEENNLPHVVDGRLATPASSINELLSDIVNSI